MPTNDSSGAYRIERVAPSLLRIFRDDRLVDEDAEHEGDCLADIERWGSAVAWAEDCTGIIRLAAQPAGDHWQVLVGVAYRYARWHFEGLTAWDEVGPDGWASRYIEIGPDGRYVAAAAAPEVLEARDTGGIDEVVVYERLYGTVPESQVVTPEAEPYLTPVSGPEFVEHWHAARHALDHRRPTR